MTVAQRVTEQFSLYRPSWVDRLTGWVRRLPGPGWGFYLALGLALAGLALLVLWAGDVPLTGPVLVAYILSGLSQAYFLGLIHFLDNSAAAALARFRPVLAVDEAGYERLRYRLTTLPARPAWVASALGALYALAVLLINSQTGASTGRETFPAYVTGLYVAYSLSISALAALTIYHTIHQLRTVSRIYTGHTRINLFQSGPLYTLSTLAARTAIGISLPTYAWFWLNLLAPGGLSISDLIPSVLFSVMILVTFIWPLLGAHRLLAREKQKLLDEAARRIEATIQRLHGHVDSGDMDHRGALKDTLDGLVIEQGVIRKLRTWPWQPETASGVGAAFLMPVILWVIQRLLTRLGL